MYLSLSLSLTLFGDYRRLPLVPKKETHTTANASEVDSITFKEDVVVIANSNQRVMF